MADAPMPPWRLDCPWCEWKVLVFPRGMRGDDPGSGVEAANLGEQHVTTAHGRSWAEFLAEGVDRGTPPR